jgi:PAS domain S-box-containing protein/putative nucleotidyltransferase with HDIG domain
LEVETYKALFDRSPKPTLYVVSKRVEAANRAAAKLFKRLGLDDPEGADFAKLWPKGTKASAKGGITALKTLKPGGYELTLRNDDTRLDVEVTPLSRKSPARRVVLIEDVTESELSEKYLGEALAKYRTVFEYSPEAIVLVDKTGEVLDLNGRVYDWLGYKRDDIRGKKITDIPFIPTKTKLKLTGALARRLLGEEIPPYEAEFKDKNGETRVGRIRATLIRDENGKIIADLVMVTDTTETKRAEEALRESEERLNATLDALPDILFEVDSEGIIYDYRAPQPDLLYALPEESLGKTVSEVFPEDASNVIMDGIARAVKEGRHVGSDFSLEMTGGVRWFDFSISTKGKPNTPESRFIVVVRDITGRKRSEEALREKRNQLKTVFESTPDFLILIDSEFVYQAVNPAFCRFMGKTEEELIGKTDFDVFPPDEAEIYRQSDIEVMTSGEPRILERQVTDADGVERLLQVAKTPILDTTGESAGILVSVSDITDRKQTEEALIASQEYTRNIISSSPDMIVSVDNERRIVEFNEAAENAFGYGKEEVLGEYVDMLYADLEESKRIDETIRKTGKYIGEITNVRKDGESFTSNLSASLLRDSDGEIVGVMGVSRDITNEKKATEALRESQQRFAALVEAALEGIVIVDAEENIVYTNTAFAETLGYSVEEIIEMNITQLVPAGQFDAILAETEKRKRGETSTYEVEFVHRDGSPRYFVVSVSAMFGRDGGYEGAYAVFLDITERKKAEEEKEKLHAEVVAAMKERQALFDGVDVLLWSIRERDDGRLYYEQANAAFAAVEGRTPDYYVGKAINEIHSPEECKRIWNSYGWAKLGELRIYEAQFEKGSEIRYFVVRIIPLRESDGTIRSFIASGMDITDRKQAEGALRESEERYRVFTEEAIVGVYIYRDGKFHFVNKEMEAITGYSADELLKISTGELISPEDRERMAERERSREKGDELPARYSMRIRRKNGESAVLMVGSRPIQYDGETAYLGNCIDITERVMAEEALKESEERIRQFAETVPDILYKFDQREGRYDFLSPAFEKMTGYSLDEIHADPCEFQLKLIHPDDTVRIMKMVNDYAAGGPQVEPLVIETRLVRADGENIWVRDSIIYEWDDGGLSSVVGVMSDITEQKQILEALSKSEREKSAILENMSEFVVYMDRELNVVWANKTVADSLESTPDALTGRKCYEMWFGRDGACENCHALTVFETGERVKRERTLSDGTIFNITCDPVRDDSGEIVGAVEVSSDITERKRNEEALRESEVRFRRFTDTVTDMIYRFDMRRREYDFISPSCEAITGYTVDEFKADPRDLWSSLIHPEDVERVKKERDEQLIACDSGDFYSLEYRIVRRGGEVVWVNEQGNLEVDEEGEITNFNGVVRNITERKHAEVVLQDTLAKLQKSLYATVSAISKIVETRDPYTSGHQTRVAKLARSIAEKMGLSGKCIELIYVAALVHDIGKISVPHEILSKPTELTELEWNIIKTHPEVGCEILRNIEFPWPVTDVVMQHHERLDGSGYPRGIGGEDIMLETRILSVADVVEAMSSHRPYRPELGIDKAIEEIEENKGKLYDTEAVDICVGLLKDKEFRFDGAR